MKEKDIYLHSQFILNINNIFNFIEYDILNVIDHKYFSPNEYQKEKKALKIKR
jgi:hypothetical protein